MRIGTWNLQGRWDARHLDLIEPMACDIWLLTEVSDRVDVPGTTVHATELLMAQRRHWAAVMTTGTLAPLPDPHGASAMAEIDGMAVCSSILPWNGCGAREPWVGSNTGEKTISAVKEIEHASPTVWGGDWNHALSGRVWSGAKAGRQAILAAVERLGLAVPTASSLHQRDDQLGIDHVAVPTSWPVAGVERHRAFVEEKRISDHDAYVVEVVHP